MTIQKYIHTSPRKLRLVADMVRHLAPEKAMEVLRFSNKAAASGLIAAIKGAIAAAKQKGMEQVNFKILEINEAPSLERFRAGSRGRVNPYKKRWSHIKIVMSDELGK